MPVLSPARPAMTARPAPRAHRALLATAVGLALGTTCLPAFALGCTEAVDGNRVTFGRNPLEAADNNSTYGYGGSGIYSYYRPTALDRLEVNHCTFDYIEHEALTTTRPIDVVVNNGPIAGVTDRGARIWDINLLTRTTNRDPGAPDARNTITLNSGTTWQVLGPGGSMPTTLNINGGTLDGAFGSSRLAPYSTIRNGDIVNIRGGVLGDTLHMGAGNGTLNLSGGDALMLDVYGDVQARTYDADTLNNPANTFDDVFNITGGALGTIHGDGGKQPLALDASGRYTGISAAAGRDTFNISGGALTEIHGDGGIDRFFISGNAAIRRLFGGYGGDTIEFAKGASLAAIGLVDGDMEDAFGLPNDDGATDTVRFRAYRGQLSDSAIGSGPCAGNPPATCTDHVQLRNFEVVELLDNSAVDLFDDAMLGTQLGDILAVEGTRLLVDATSRLTARTGVAPYPARLHYNVQNDGVLDLGQDAPGHTLSISGDYAGTGRVLMSTVLGDDTSATDRLVIGGNVSGRTTLDIKPVAGSTGAQTVDGILLVQTQRDKTVAVDAFVLTAPITTENGLWQYRLAQRTATLQQRGGFFLTSAAPPPPPPPTPPTPPPSTPTPPPVTPTPPPVTPVPPPVTPTPIPDGERLLAPTVTVLALATGAAQDLALDAIGTARDRQVQRRMATYGDGEAQRASPGWARVRFDRTETQGRRLGIDQQQFVFQGGLDLQADDRVQRGLMATYATASGDVHDHLRPTLDGFTARLASNVGDVRTQWLGVGGYQTLAWRSGWYLDTVLQAGALRVALEGIDGMRERTTGWNAAASAEIGRGIAMAGGAWTLEPQAQLIASHTRLGDIDSGLVSSDGLDRTALRGRLGVRIATAAAATATAGQMYGIANLWHDLRDGDGTTVAGGTDRITVEPALARTWAELGLGVQQAAGRGRWFFDVRGQGGIGRGDRTGFAAQAGYTMAW